MAGKRLSNKQGQSSLEMAIAIAAVLLLLLGALRLFFWVNQTLVLRHQLYEGSRVSATEASTEAQAQVNEAGLPALNLVQE